MGASHEMRTMVVVIVVLMRSADEEQNGRGQRKNALPMVALWISGSTLGSCWGRRMGLSADAMVVVSWVPAAARPRRVPGSQQRMNGPY